MKMVYERPLMRVETFEVNSYCATNCDVAKYTNDRYAGVDGNWFFNVWWTDSKGDHTVKFFNTNHSALEFGDIEYGDAWVGSETKDGVTTDYVLTLDKTGISGKVYENDNGGLDGVAGNYGGDLSGKLPDFEYRRKNHSF